MGVIFDKHRANFNGIIEKSSIRNDTQRLYVSEVRHKARISVGEEGTIAVAATQGRPYAIYSFREKTIVMLFNYFFLVTITTHGGRPMPILPNYYKPFNANHSFLFVILNCENDVLFSGRFGG